MNVETLDVNYTMEKSVVVSFLVFLLIGLKFFMHVDRVGLLLSN